MSAVSIYTDGSFSKGFGGYGYVMIYRENVKQVSSNQYKSTTNNRMELKAIIHALETVKPGFKIDIYSDSQYCINTINQYLNRWIKKMGEQTVYKTKLNGDLWERFSKARKKHEENNSKLTFNWVRGHSHNEWNNKADKLANAGRMIGEPVECKQYN